MRTPFAHRPVRAALALAAAVLCALALTACGSDDDPAAAGTSSGAGTTAAADALPDKITVAYQLIPNGDLVVKHKGWLEEALPGVTIEWKQFDSGGSVNEAFAAGSIDIGLAGSSPVSRGLSQGIDYRVPWIHDVIGKAEALVVTDGIGSVADLRGKKVATPLASTAHYSLLAALRDAGVDPADVDIIDAEPADIQAAWTRGDIDAAYVWNPTTAALVADGGTILVDSEQLAAKGYTTYDLAVVSGEFADRYPAALEAWVAQQDRAVRLYRDDEADAVAAIAAELNLSPEDALAQTRDLVFLTAAEQVEAANLPAVGPALLSTASFNRDLGQITDLADDAVYAAAVDTAAAGSVAASTTP